MRPRVIRAALAIALPIGIALACSPAPVAKDSVTILLTGDILSLDPNQDVESTTDSVLFNVFEPLVGFDENLEVKPILAESWEHPRPELWRFALRRNVHFQDGVALTAPLVRDAIQAVQQSPRQEASAKLGAVKALVAQDDYTLDIETFEPRALLTSLPFVYVAKPNQTGAFPPLVGTGAYCMREWTPGSRVAVERWDGFRGTAPFFRTAQFEPVQDARARLARLKDGSADIIYVVPPELAQDGQPGVRFVRHTGLAVYYLGFDVRDRPGNRFHDLRVRQAFHLALDREAIVTQLLRGKGSIPTQPVAPQVFGFNPELPAPRHDKEEARRLLAQAGYPNGLRGRVHVQYANLDAARGLVSSLREVGIELELAAVEKQAFYEQARTGQCELFFMGYDCGTGEASEFYESVLHTRGERFGYGNYGGYSEPELDRIAETNAAVLDQRERLARLQAAAAIAMRDLPVLPVFIRDEIYGVREHLRFRARADSEIRIDDLGYLTPR